MQDPDLQAATASEPLSIDEEYAMQKSWQQDPDKLTFIVCKPLDASTSSCVQATVHDAPPDRMIGDINLFLLPSEDDDGDDDDGVKGAVIGEIELMIARKDFQRQGYGRAALLTFMDYILDNWGSIGSEYSSQRNSATTAFNHLAYLRVKINETNVGSIKLFEKLGFRTIGKGANYFGEIELRRQPDLDLDGQRGREEVRELRYLVEKDQAAV